MRKKRLFCVRRDFSCINYVLPQFFCPESSAHKHKYFIITHETFSIKFGLVTRHIFTINIISKEDGLRRV